MDLLKSLFVVGVGSFAGGSLRYLISVLMKSPVNGFPFGTLCVNLLGCLLIGVFYGFAARHPLMSQNTLLLLTTGFCGGFTTFSTFANESLQLLQSQNITAFAVYISASVILGIALVFCGYALTKLFA